MQHLYFDPDHKASLLRDHRQTGEHKDNALESFKLHTHPRGSRGDEDASAHFIGTATTVIEWQGFRILTDPNFLHAGDHVHLGPGVTATRRTNPAIDLHELPPIDFVLLSHYHEDHFDKLVEDAMDRKFPIITTPHAKHCLEGKETPFQNVTGLDTFQHCLLHVGTKRDATIQNHRAIKVTAMPGKHVPPGPLAQINDLLGAVPPTNGWLVELGHASPEGQASNKANEGFEVGYRIYISGDTLFVDELKQIPRHLSTQTDGGAIDLMLVHLGGTSIPGPNAPLLMVTMDAAQGLELVRLVDPDVTIPIHYDDYSVFVSPLSDFKEAMAKADMQDRVIYLDRGECYKFSVRESR